MNQLHKLLQTSRLRIHEKMKTFFYTFLNGDIWTVSMRQNDRVGLEQRIEDVWRVEIGNFTFLFSLPDFRFPQPSRWRVNKTRSTSQGKGAKPKSPTYGFDWFGDVTWRHEISQCCPSKVISLFWCKTEKCSFLVSKSGVPISSTGMANPINEHLFSSPSKS